jgi:virginiamycin A acetyltransferase
MDALAKPMRALAEALGFVATFPLVLAYRSGLIAFASVATGLAPVPGRVGRVLRRAWYRQTLAACGVNLVVEFGSAIRTPKSRVGDNCHIGVYNWLGWVDIGDDFMSGNFASILSGARQHKFDRLDVPMRLQGGEHSCISIGDDVWVGASATISADVAAHTIVASGAVVTRSFDEYDILAGVPAKPIGSRRTHPVATERLS